MKALLFDKSISIAEIPKPARKSGEALIKVLLAGICNTDLEITRGYMGYKGVIGHEFVGVVEDSENHSLINKRVVGEINFGCGRCEYCLSGLERHCPNRTVLGIQDRQGAFAQYVSIPDKNIYHIPDNVPDNQAVFVEPLAAAVEILEQVKIEPTSLVAIVGDGKLALLILQVIQLTGNRCFLFGKHKEKLEIASQLGGKALAAEKGSSKKFDFVIEASGKKEGFDFALDIIKPRGTIILKSTYQDKTNMNFAKIVIDEINITGSRCGPFAPALSLLEKKRVQVEPLISKIFPFRAFVYAQKNSLKVLIDFK